MKKFDFLRDRVSFNKKEKILKDICKDADETMQIAKNLVDSKDYNIFKGKFFRILNSSINELIDYEEPDPVKYKIQVKEILLRLKIMRDFMDDVETLAE